MVRPENHDIFGHGYNKYSFYIVTKYLHFGLGYSSQPVSIHQLINMERDKLADLDITIYLE